MIHKVVYKKKRAHTKVPGGFFSFEEEATKTRLHGFGYGEHIRLRDEFGNVWSGSAEKGVDDAIRYTFRDANGRTITGVSDGSGITLRDHKGKTWRGFID